MSAYATKIGRSLVPADLLGLVEKLKDKGCGLKVLTGAGASIDTTKLEGRLHFAMLAAFADDAERATVGAQL